MKALYQIVFFVALTFMACNKKPPLATVITHQPTFISENSAVCGGLITGIGVNDKGICWAMHTNPSLEDNFQSAGEGSSQFSITLEDLNPSTTYYIKAYVNNEAGTSYGEVKSFRTSNVIYSNTVFSMNVWPLGADSLLTSTTINVFPSDLLIEYGVCYSQNPNPVIKDGKVSASSMLGSSFEAIIKSLQTGIDYYVRPFYRTQYQITYGNAIKVRTFGEPVTDVDGNKYNTVKIGNQTWMVENLRTTKFNDGTTISYIQQSNTWITTTSPAYGYYNNSSFNQLNYGNLYNLYTITGNKNIAPVGWHVAKKEDYEALFTYLGGINSPTLYKLMKNSTLWQNFNYGNNESSFSALPGGARRGDVVQDVFMGSRSYFWTSTSFAGGNYCIMLNADATATSINILTDVVPNSGLSIRCVKD